MALVKCKECKNTISNNATSCPNCGAKPPKKTSFITWVATCFVVFIFAVMVFSEPMTPAQKAERQKVRAAQKVIDDKKDAVTDQKTREQLWIVKGKDAVTSKLKDPQSAKFKGVYFYQKDKTPMTCGQVNSKNSFGGFAGFQYFISAGSSSLTFLEDDVDDFATLWNTYCTK